MLTAALRDHWRRHAWVWLRGVLGEDARGRLARWTDEVTAWPEVPGAWMRYYERRAGPPAERILARVENFVPYHEPLAAFFSSATLMALLAECAGAPVVLFKDKINLKLAGGAGFTPHQDAPAYAGFGVDDFVTLMVPVDRFTEENGCLVVAHGAGARGVLPQNPDGTIRADVLARLEPRSILAEPGDVIVFDGWVPHWSGPNRSAGARRAYYLTFNPRSAGDRRGAYYARKRETFPPEYERRPGVDYRALGRQFNLGNPFE